MLAIIVVTLVLLCGPLPTARAADIVTFPASTTRTLPPGWDGSLSIPVDFTGATPSVLVRAVVRGTEQLDTTVTAVIRDRALQIRADDVDAFLEQGSYIVTLEVRRKAERQTAQLTLTRAAAALTPVGTIKLTEEGFWSTHVTGLADQVVPVGIGERAVVNRVWAEAVTPGPGRVQLQLCAPGTSPPECQPLDTPVSRQSAEPGGALQLKVGLAGEFVYGTTAQVVRLHSPQLAEPVSLAFEVRRERPLSLLVLLILAGVTVGVATRSLLPWMINHFRTRQAKRRLTTRVQELVTGTKDRVLVKELTGLQTELGKVEGHDPKAAARLVELGAEIDSLLAAHDKALAELQARLAPVQDALSPDWKLPRQLDERRGEARAAWDELTALLTEGDLTSAKDRQYQVGLSVQSLGQAAQAWLTELTVAAKHFAASLPKQQVGGIQEFDTLGRHLTALAELEAPESTLAPDPVAASVVAARQLELVHSVTDGSRRTYDLIKAAAHRLATTLGKEDVAGRVEAAINDNAANLVAALNCSNQAMSELFSVKYGNQSLNDGYQAARLDAVPTPAGGPLGALGVAERLGPIGLRFGIGLATSVRSFLLAVIAALGLFVLNLPLWTGETSQLLSIFLAAFALDVTAAAVVNSVKPAAGTAV